MLAALPGVASYCFRPRRLSVEQQNRAIALSYYAWAPLAAAPLMLLFSAAGAFITVTKGVPDPPVVLLILAAALLVGAAALAYFGAVLPPAAAVLALPFFVLAWASVSTPPSSVAQLLVTAGVAVYAALLVLSYALLAAFAGHLFRLTAPLAVWRAGLLLAMALGATLLLALVPLGLFYIVLIWRSFA